jgi:phage protein D/phage baseplate assembly protein gpV
VPAANRILIHHPTIKAEGTPLTDAIADKLLELEIESTYNRPDLCTMTFDVDLNTEIPTTFELGAAIEVTFKPEDPAGGSPIPSFKGEVTALDFDGLGERTVFTVQCESLLHRLFHVDKTRTFLKSTITDVVGKMAGDAGLTADSEALSTSYDFLMQQNVSDAAWLVAEASKRNYHVWSDGKKLCFKKIGTGGDSGVSVEYGMDLLTFSARVSAGAYLKEASVRGWDVKQKKAIEGTSTSYSGRKDSKVATTNGTYAGTAVLTRAGDVPAQGEATKIAESVMARSNEHNLQAEGTCHGNPSLRVDTEVEVKGANTRFNGKYRISRVRHRMTNELGYVTEFACRGASDQSISGLFEEVAGSRNRAADRNIFDGVAVAIVTDNNDPDDLGRVKVKFPTLAMDNGKENASDWMRVAFPGGGGSKHHGWYLLPEVDDEVLVVFEHGDARRGYVIGGLLNGIDKPFYKKDKVLSSGKVKQHAFRMNNGAHLLFDETDGQEVLELKSKGDKFIFKFEEKNGVTLKNESSGDKLEIDNKGNVTVTSQSGDITIEAKAGGINLKAVKDITLDAKGNVKIKAAQEASVEAGTNAKLTGTVGAEVKGNATAKLEASGQTTVKGAMVMIN